MRFLCNLRQAYKLTCQKFCVVSCAYNEWGQLNNRFWESRPCSSYSIRNRKPRKRVKKSLAKQPRRHRSITNQPPGDGSVSNQSISPIAIISDMEKTHKIALIPVNLFKEKVKNEHAFKEAMGILSLLRNHALDVNLFMDSCIDIKLKPSNEMRPELFTVKDVSKKLHDATEPHKYTDFKIETTMNIEPEKNPATKEPEQLTEKTQKLDVSFHLPTDIERDLKQIPVSGMDINFEMNMTNIKDAILNCNQFSDLPFHNKSLPNPTLSMSTNLRMNSDEEKTIPLHFNAIIRGTVNVDPKEFSDEKLKNMRVSEFNEFVTAVAANICSTALQKGFRIDTTGREKIEKETMILPVPSEENKNVKKTEQQNTSKQTVSPELSSLFRKYDQMHERAYQQRNFPNNLTEDEIINDLVKRYDSFKNELTAIEADALYPTNESLKEWLSLPSSRPQTKKRKSYTPAEKNNKLERDIRKKKREYPVIKSYVTVDSAPSGHEPLLPYEKEKMVSSPLQAVNTTGLIMARPDSSLPGSDTDTDDIASEIRKIQQHAISQGAKIFVNELQVIVPTKNTAESNVKKKERNDDEVLGDNLNNTPKK